MALDFPTTGLVANVTTVTQGGRTWLWTGVAWKAITSTLAYSVGAWA
jgi:hypothetical protein